MQEGPLNVVLSPTEPPAFVTVIPTKEVNRVIIPDDWGEFADTDSQFGLTTTLSLPVAFGFSFSGSEWSINSLGGEHWDYASSVKGAVWSEKCDKKNDQFDDFREYTNRCCLEGRVNTYRGGSRRAWYSKYINDGFSCDYPGSDNTGQIIAVEEFPVNSSSYLKVGVKYVDGRTQTGYLYVQSGIMHILSPLSEKARSDDSFIAQNIAIVFASLRSSFVK